jgi:hypothetical protein
MKKQKSKDHLLKIKVFFSKLLPEREILGSSLKLEDFKPKSFR